jgi:hypothetical protein
VTEKLALAGLMARNREIERALDDDYRALAREVEKRLELDEGAIGTTHAFDAGSLSLTLVPEE